jgi:hypothetical protein
MTDEPDNVLDFLSFLPPSILEENGKIAIAFTFMEDELNGFISDLLCAGMTAGQGVTSAIRNITDRIELARTLVKSKVKIDDHRATALDLLADTQKANTKRNTLIHGAITRFTFNVDPDAHEVEYLKKDHRVRERKGVPFKVAELKHLTKELRRLALELSKSAQRHRVACGMSTRQP